MYIKAQQDGILQPNRNLTLSDNLCLKMLWEARWV